MHAILQFRILISVSVSLTLLNDNKKHPVFNSISNEPEYQKIVRNVDTKYQVLHKNVEVWLKDQGKL